jgi:tRNA dimethylallyltransferase
MAPPACHLPFVVVLGQTAAGKTALGIELARRLNGEIISADSRQVYRNMDIGTAKPSPAERRLVPHHLIDVVDPDQPFGLAQYLDLAKQNIADVHAREGLPVVVGGTAQYVWALVEGWQVPRVVPMPALRAALEERARADGALNLHHELASRDPAAAAAIHPHNVRRVIRALELLESTGELASSLRERRAPAPPAILIGLWLPRDELYCRIDRRVDAMFAGGLVDEARSLLAAGYAPSLPALNSVGYAQSIRHLRGELDVVSAIAETKTATHRLARQQAAWFHRDDRRIAWQRPGDIDTAVATIEALAPRAGAKAPP